MASLMTTGYVHKMLDDEMDFPTFALSCARAFGALILMRDDAADAPIPDEFKPEPYYAKSVVSARAALAEFELKNEGERLAWAESSKQEHIRDLRESMSKQSAEIAKCKAMLDRVQAWQPPTKDHEEMKNFMVKQLSDTVDREDDGFPYHQGQIAKLIAMDAATMIIEHIDGLRRCLASAEKSLADEERRCADRTEWVKQLRASLA